MKSKTIPFLLFILLIAAVSSSLYAEPAYEFDGKSYILDPFIDNGFKSNFSTLPYEALDNYPLKVDLKNIQTVGKDQGNRGSCGYFSATALLESLIKKRQGEEVNISEEYLVYYTKAILNQSSSSESSYSYNNIKALQSGFMLEKDVPYHSSWFAKGLPCEAYDKEEGNAKAYCYSHYAPSKEILKRKIRTDGFYISSINSSIKPIVKWLAEKKSPVVVSLPVNQKGWDKSSGACIYNQELREECLLEPKKCGTHSVLIYGYDRQKKVFFFKNSWGKDWGKKGFGTLTFEYVGDYSGQKGLTGYLYKDVSLPANHNYFKYPSAQNVMADWQLLTGENSKEVVTTLYGHFYDLPSSVFYVSTFIAYPKKGTPDTEEISDNNSMLLQVPLAQREKHGYFVRGAFYHLLKDNELQGLSFDTNNPAQTMIPYEIIDKNALEGQKAYLRISAYVYSDVEGWQKLYRQYHPFQL